MVKKEKKDNKDNRKIIRTVLLFLLCAALNFCGRLLTYYFKLPMWLDMIGTCVACYYLGLPGGILAAVSNNVFFMLVNGKAPIYCLTGIVCALVMHFSIKKGNLERLPMAMFTSFWIGFCSVAVSTPLNLVFYGGYSGNIWGDALFEMLRWYGVSKLPAALLGELVVEILDKQICILAGFGIIRLLRRLHERAEKKLRGGLQAGAFVVFFLTSLLLPQVNAEAVTTEAIHGYCSRVFDNQNGLISSDANVIAETADGFIWIGGYSGLTRYDGSQFQFIREGGIVNVTTMLCDSKGRLWIGTNDSGIARYENGSFVFFKTEDGLAANSIRAFCEGENGEMYIATTGRICVFDDKDNIRIYSKDVNYILSMTMHEGMLVCVGNDKNVYAFQDGQLLARSGKLNDEHGEPVYFNCVGSNGERLIGGTSAETLYELKVQGGRILVSGEIALSLSNIRYVKGNPDGKIWISGDGCCGYLEGEVFHAWNVGEEYTSLECVHEDYQGNIWIASSRYGVLCLSKTPFENLFEAYGLEPAVCNAVIPYQGGYCIGMDSGLLILDKNGKKVENEATKLLGEHRIRSLMQDSSGNLWICTYSDHGLVCLKKDNTISCYTTEEYSMIPNNRTRCIEELFNHIIAVGTADGIYFIKNEKVISSITQSDGLINSQILSLQEGKDGSLYAGTDGAGLYVIKDQKIVRNYSTKSGLSSDIILRVCPTAQGLLLVTSNSLCLLTDEVRVLDNFPYYNNYDILLHGGTAYVLSSGGVFVVDEKELCRNEKMSYELYDAKHGLQGGITANSWNFVDEGGRLNFCCNDGVVRYMPTQMESMDYRFGLSEVSCDGQPVALSGNFAEIPENTREIVLKASLRNYAMTDLKVKFFIEGMEAQEEALVSYSNLDALRIINPAAGKYVVHLQIYDGSGKNLLKEESYMLVKNSQMWEKGWYKAYLVFMLLEVVVYLIWTAVLILDERRKRQLEAERVKKEHQEVLLSQTVLALAKTVDAKDNYTKGHSTRVAQYSKMIAARMGKDEAEQAKIYRAGLLHDVGKIRVPESVINKPGKLNEDEFAMIKLHPITGYHILKEISFDSTLSDGARYHHERYDGRGYPNGLIGEQIPEIARIICVADTYDAMASNRSYRTALDQATIRAEIERGRGTQFDPAIADIMLEIIDEDKDYQLKEMTMSRKKILVVDDQAINISLAKLALKDVKNYVVDGVESGEEAIERLKKEHYDLMLLDIVMQHMDGYQTADEVRKFSDIPIVFVTSDKLSLDSQHMQNANIADYITKPYKPLTLKEILHAILADG